MAIFNLSGGGQPVLQAKQATPSKSQQIILPDEGYDGLSEVDINATPLETRTVNPSTSSQTITPSSSSIGFSSVTVNPVKLQSKSGQPTVPYTFVPDSGYNGLSSVTFLKTPTLLSENIKHDVGIYGVYGELYPMSTCQYRSSGISGKIVKFTPTELSTNNANFKKISNVYIIPAGDNYPGDSYIGYVIKSDNAVNNVQIGVGFSPRCDMFKGVSNNTFSWSFGTTFTFTINSDLSITVNSAIDVFASSIYYMYVAGAI
nr:MAG TPA: hypothetical protein [Caudoviricetes sp.]